MLRVVCCALFVGCWLVCGFVCALFVGCGSLFVARCVCIECLVKSVSRFHCLLFVVGACWSLHVCRCYVVFVVSCVLCVVCRVLCVVCCSLRVARCVLFVVRCVLCVLCGVGCLMYIVDIVVSYSVFVGRRCCCLLRVVRCSLFVLCVLFCCLMLIVCCVLWFVW